MESGGGKIISPDQIPMAELFVVGVFNPRVSAITTPEIAQSFHVRNSTLFPTNGCSKFPMCYSF